MTLRLFTGFIDERPGVTWDAPTSVQKHLRSIVGEEVEVTIQKRRRRRSNQANRYWWGVVIRTAAESLGYADPEELHEAVCFKFRPLPPDPLTGAPRRARTSQMSSQEFTDFASEVIQWLEADLKIRVPRPHEIDEVA